MKFSIPLLFLLFMGLRVNYYMNLNTQNQEYTHHHTIEKMKIEWLSSTHYTNGKLGFSQPLWLIVAYSVSDDFEGHPIIWKHTQVDFSE